MNTDPARQLNRTLSAAKKAKQDEFYTQYGDIQKEVEAYLEFDPDTFRGKVVYCNCDDPFESNFFKYFAANFNKLGLKKLVTTSYDGSPIAGQGTLFPEYNEGNGERRKPKALAFEIEQVKDVTGDGATGIEDVRLFLEQNPHTRTPLAGGGDFRSPECIARLKEADIVVTNPPFSLFREYVAQLVEHGKKFLIIGNKNAITYKEVFPLIKDDRLWLGVTPMGTDMLFDVPPGMAEAMLETGKKGSNYKIVNGKVMGRSTSAWFTNLDHGRRHQELPLMTMADNLKFSNHKEIKGKAAYDRTLSAAKKAKQDEFYTQYDDIQNEVAAYLEHDPNTFRGKVVYCNCDDPFESNFFKYFAANFNKLGLKRLITTSYDGSPIAGQLALFPEYDAGNSQRRKPKALAVILDQVQDEDGDGAANIADVELFLKRNQAARTGLRGDDKYPGGDFRSPECMAYLEEADIVVTNPPFSLFREYVAQLMEYGKTFLIIGNVQAITYKEIFPLIKADKLWMGVTIHSGDREFRVPDHYPLNAAGWRVDENGVKYIRVKGVRWYTNLDHGRRHEELPLMTMADNLKFSKHKEIKGKPAYIQYDNYDAIEVPFTDAIPSDYDGVMGVPITFLDKYNPDQFEIVDLSRYTKTTGMSKEFVDAYYESGQTGQIFEGHPDLCYYDHNKKPVVPYMRVLIKGKKGRKR